MSKKLISEAKKCLKDGDDALKTSLFKWNKDYVTAASCFEEAAKLYRQAKEFDAATKVLEKCITINDKLNDNWGVAKNYEAILTMATDRTDGVKPSPEPMVKWAVKAGTYFRLSKAHHKYITLVKKVAKYLDDEGHLMEAMNLFKHLLNDLEDDEQHYIRSETVTDYAALLVKVRRYPECITLFEREYTLKKNQVATKGGRQNLDSLALTIIVLYIIIGDIDKAEKKLQDYAIEIRDFVKSPEFDVLEKMLEAYIDGKQADFNKNASRGIIDNIYPYNIIKDLRDVKVKACPENRRIINLDEESVGGMNETSSISRGQTNSISRGQPRSDYSSAIGGVTNVGNEEQRQKALDDFLC